MNNDGDSPETKNRLLKSQNELPTLDAIVLNQLQSELTEEVMSELIDIFLAELSKATSQIREALSLGNRQSLVAIAHKLRGAAGNLGAMRLMALCTDLEKKSQIHELASVHDLVETIGLEQVAVASQFGHFNRKT